MRSFGGCATKRPRHRKGRLGERRTVAVLSPDYLTSCFGAPEWAAAFAQDSEGLERRLVPVRVRDAHWRGCFGAIVHIDLVGLDEAHAREQLRDGLAAKRGKPD
jgi:hypothetical protein